GVVVGVPFVSAREIRREDRLYSLADEAPSLMSRGTRRLTGFGRRDLQMRVLTAGRRAAAYQSMVLSSSSPPDPRPSPPSGGGRGARQGGLISARRPAARLT